jgi:aldose 1-epimerase
MRRHAFVAPDGADVELLTISAGRHRADIISLGASIADLVVAAGAGTRSVVLGMADIADYGAFAGHMGAVAGRCANRIAAGRFTLDGRDFQLPLNERDRSHLHGGFNGFGHRVWSVEAASDTRIDLSIASPDGEEGYPGTVKATCAYEITENGVLGIELSATTDAPTLVNLATHSYFNLGLSQTILDHNLTIPAGHYLPVDANLIPTGEIASVAGTGFDFRQRAKIGERRAMTSGGFDHNYVIAMEPAAAVRQMARLEAPAGDLAMEVWSTEPGVQFYDGKFLPVKHPLRGDCNRQFGGCCLEPQRFPDGINHPGWPNGVLRPGEVYRQRTEYRFFD